MDLHRLQSVQDYLLSELKHYKEDNPAACLEEIQEYKYERCRHLNGYDLSGLDRFILGEWFQNE